jgi:hypothetical protein
VNSGPPNTRAPRRGWTWLRDSSLPFLVSVYFFALGAVAIAEDTPAAVYATVTVWFLCVISVQLLVVWGASHFHGATAIRNAISSCFAAANVIAFYLAFFGGFVSRGPALQILAWLGISGAVWASLYLAQRLPFLWTLLSAILIANTAFTVGHAMTSAGGGTPTAGNNLAPYGAIKLARKPNIHLIAVDSMLPETLANRHLGIATDYDRFMREHGAVVFRNLFASFAPTTESLSSVARLADPSFSGHDGFSGRTLEPLYHIFRNNGYRIASGYNAGKRNFGDQGPAVDEYVNSNAWGGRTFSQSALCKYQDAVERGLQLYGFCALAVRLEPAVGGSWEDYVDERIGEKGSSPTSWLTFHYVYSALGHTSKAYVSTSQDDFVAYRKVFFEKQRSMARDWLPKLTATIAARDPHAIVFVFGDHGPWLSRTIQPDDMPRFYVQDRYGIFGAVLNTDDPCVAEGALTHYFDGFGTPERVIAGIVRCLASNPEAVDRAVNFRETGPFRAYLYE